MLNYVLGSSQKIASPNKTVKIDKSKFGRRKNNKGHKVKEQWMFGGVERVSGKAFLVAVPDRTRICLWLFFVKESNPALQSTATAGQHTGT
jgi:hypothetical protein